MTDAWWAPESAALQPEGSRHEPALVDDRPDRATRRIAARRAGYCPEWTSQRPTDAGRALLMLSTKDIAPEGENEEEDGWADVGHGTLDWTGLTRALQGAGVDLFVMEHDKPADARRFAERSIAAFKGF